MRSRAFAHAAHVASLFTLVACSSSKEPIGFEVNPHAEADSGGDITFGNDDGDGGPSVGVFGTTPDTGASPSEGCHADPSYYDIPGDHCDNDGNGIVDDTPSCDGNLPALGSAIEFAKAMGLCQTAS